jgi:hypothetical protein
MSQIPHSSPPPQADCFFSFIRKLKKTTKILKILKILSKKDRPCLRRERRGRQANKPENLIILCTPLKSIKKIYFDLGK